MYLEVVGKGSSAFIPIQCAHFIIYNKVYKKYCHSLIIQITLELRDDGHGKKWNDWNDQKMMSLFILI